MVVLVFSFYWVPGIIRKQLYFLVILTTKKGSLHFNISSVFPNQKFRLQFSGSYLIDDNQLMQRDLTQSIIRMVPVAPKMYNADGSLNWAPDASGNSSWVNPLASLNNRYTVKTNNLISNLLISYQFFQGLDIKTSLGYTNLQSNQSRIFPLSSTPPELRPYRDRWSDFSNDNASSWNFEPQITYNKNIGKGKLDVLVGSTLFNRITRMLVCKPEPDIIAICLFTT